MNKWQKTFILLGALAILFLIGFPPEITMSGKVQFLPVTYGCPIDWLSFFIWLVVLLFITGLGVAANKDEHSK